MGTGVGEAMLIGAVTGAGTAAVTGGDPLKGALLGAAGGGIGAGVAGATTGATAGTAATGTAAAGTGAAGGAELANLAGLGDTGVALETIGTGSTAQPLIQTPSAIMDPGLNSSMMGDGGVETVTNTNFRPGTTTSNQNPMFPNINKLYQNNPNLFPAASGAFANVLGNKPPGLEEEDEYSGALSRFSYSPDRYTSYRAASGGLMDTAVARRMAGGGLGSYSDGGQTLQGPGDGMSDSIPATIGGAQPARLADGEFVVPADVVSGIGNGSTDAGARQLYSMMDKVREARTGRTRQAPEINPRRMMPA